MQYCASIQTAIQEKKVSFISVQSMTIYNEYNVTSIGCFHCTSIGGDNPACEDPFNSTEAFKQGLYKDNCLAGMKDRGGLYPATACVKFDGYYSEFLKVHFQVMNNEKFVSATIIEGNFIPLGEFL